MDHEHDHGVVVACDVDNLEELGELVDKTAGVEGIEGYKIGATLGLSYGLSEVSSTIRERTDTPIIFDYQKLGTDVPFISGEAVPKVISDADIDAAILFPQSGPVTEKATIEGLSKRGIEPIVGGEMTHDGYLEKEGGYIRDDAPPEMYLNGARYGAERFVVPGNRAEAITNWTEVISEVVESPVLYSPGFGRQGGDVTEGIEAAKEANGNISFYAIIGSGIYKQPVPEDAKYPLFESPKEAAKFFAKQALEYGD